MPTPPRDVSPIKSADLRAVEPSIVLPKRGASPSSSLYRSVYRQSNQSYSSLFASTSSLPGSGTSSGTATPTGLRPDSTLSPGGSVRPRSPAVVSTSEPSGLRSLIQRAFAPHVTVLSSQDTEELLQGKGFPGGFLQLIRPFGECISGKVTVRDSIGASKSWDDFGIRITGLEDGLNPPKPPSAARRSAEAAGRGNDKADRALDGLLERSLPRDLFPAWTRTGGDVTQIEEVVDRHLEYAEVQDTAPSKDPYAQLQEALGSSATTELPSPFYSLYLRRLLSALPMSPHETFSHPVACIIAISSRNPAPIEDLRRLYNATNTGELRLPQWVNNEYLRYYVLVHDEDHDDIQKSTALYEQMKRHFGLHCHLLRLRSNQCLPSDDDSIRLSASEWVSAAEELDEIQRRELSDEIDDPTPCLFETDAAALRSLLRELVAQSLIPTMERQVSTWNETILSKRRGLSGRFTSLTKRWTPFGGGSSRNSSGPLAGLQAGGQGSSGNYDSLQGFYRPETPEASLRKLADYAFMLRDYKLAASTYDLLRSDYNTDKAWRYHAGANEMAAIATLLDVQTRPNATASNSAKNRLESVDSWLETAAYSYVTRCIAPYYALRTLAIGSELLKMRGTATAGDDATRWGCRVLEMGLAGPVGRPLFMERISAAYRVKQGVGKLRWGSRRRKAAFWAVLAVESWVRMDKVVQAGRMLDRVSELYGLDEAAAATGGTEHDVEQEKQPGPEGGLAQASRELSFDAMKDFIEELREAVMERKMANAGHIDVEVGEGADDETLVEEISEKLDARPQRLSIIGVVPPVNMDTGPRSPVKTRVDDPLRDDSFE